MQLNAKTVQRKLGALVLGTTLITGLIGSCSDRLVGFTRFVDPCGTVLANCQPGDFETNAADVGDFCVDPACTVPGACDNRPVLGTITQLCP